MMSRRGLSEVSASTANSRRQSEGPARVRVQHPFFFLADTSSRSQKTHTLNNNGICRTISVLRVMHGNVAPTYHSTTSTYVKDEHKNKNVSCSFTPFARPPSFHPTISQVQKKAASSRKSLGGRKSLGASQQLGNSRKSLGMSRKSLGAGRESFGFGSTAPVRPKI